MTTTVPMSDEQFPFKRSKAAPEKQTLQPNKKVDLGAVAHNEMPQVSAEGNRKAKERKEEYEVKDPIEPSDPRDFGEERDQSSEEPEFDREPEVSRTETGGVEYSGYRKKRPSNPVIELLRKKFGVDNIPTIDRPVGGVTWTFRKADYKDNLYARAVSSSLMNAPTGSIEETYNFVLVCTCIAAINGMPTYKAMEVDVRPGERVDNHLYPPEGVRHRAAASLLDILSSSDEDLPKKLVEAYKYEYKKSGIVSYLDFVKDNMFLFYCPVEGCDYEIMDIVMEDPTTKEILPYYCKFHGKAMEKKGEAGPSPLA